MGNETGWITASLKWDLSEVERKFHIKTQIGQAGPVTWDDVLHDAFWLAEIHSFQYFQALSQGSEVNFFPYETKTIFIPLRWIITASWDGAAHITGSNFVKFVELRRFPIVILTKDWWLNMASLRMRECDVLVSKFCDSVKINIWFLDVFFGEFR